MAWRGTGYAGRWRCSQHVNARPTLAFIHGGPFDTNMYQPAGILEPWRRHCLVCACKGHRHTHAHAHMHPRSLAVRCVHSRRVKPHGTKRAVKALGKEKVAAGTRPASGEAAQGAPLLQKEKGQSSTARRSDNTPARPRSACPLPPLTARESRCCNTNCPDTASQLVLQVSDTGRSLRPSQ